MVSRSRHNVGPDNERTDSGTADAPSRPGDGTALAPRRPTGHDVARLAGVSQASVSLVFSGNGGKRVSKATEKRVRDAADLLGYRPQAAARQLRLGRTGLTLLAIPNIRGPFFARVLASAHDAADAHGLTVVVSSDWTSETLARTITANQFDGLMICSPNDRQIGELPPFLPTVLLDADPALAGKNRQVVELDVAGGMRAAVEHLADLGHRSIGHLRYHRASHTFRARQSGFDAAAARLQVTEYAISLAEELDATRDAAHKLLSAASPPRAVICDDDVAAAGVYHAAAAFGLRIPDDISVVGMDNIDAASLLTPGLTTVDLHGEKLGELGIAALTTMLQGESVAPTGLVRTRLVVRQSTGPADPAVRGPVTGHTTPVPPIP
ncbi:LacI family DNA-binding transcriptional regulator [Streptomyces decoyicus]|uniref:LacI family DNA-binding transcriptional regulator n=1 Tax=Streptomyces decoyicus TaxID=249567 RepID=UPI0036375BB7